MKEIFEFIKICFVGLRMVTLPLSIMFIPIIIVYLTDNKWFILLLLPAWFIVQVIVSKMVSRVFNDNERIYIGKDVLAPICAGMWGIIAGFVLPLILVFSGFMVLEKNSKFYMIPFLLVLIIMFLMIKYSKVILIGCDINNGTR